MAACLAELSESSRLETEATLFQWDPSLLQATTRFRALYRLHESNDPHIVENAVRSLRDPDPAVRAAALEILVLHQAIGHLPAIAQILPDDPDPDVRMWAASALNLLTGGSCPEDPDAALAWWAAHKDDPEFRNP